MVFIVCRVAFLYPGEKLAPMWMAPVILAVPERHALFRDLTGIQFQPVVFSFCAGINIISRSEDRKIGAR